MTRTAFFIIFFATLAHLILPLSAAAEAPEGVSEPRHMFVTSVGGTGDLGSWPEAGGATGITAGDTICRTLALQQGLPNANDYKAWLSDFFNDAFCRIRGFGGLKSNNCGQALFSPNGPWTRLDGFPFSGNLFDLAMNGPMSTAMVDETGQPTPIHLIYTGTMADGTRSLERCANWTSSSDTAVMGRSDTTKSLWTAITVQTCASTNVHLMCFDPGLPADPLPLETAPAGLVFVTSAKGTGDLSSWPLAGGLDGTAGADTVCRQLASTAGLPFPQSFVAWLSTPGNPAGDALPADLPWRRLDGVRVADSLSDLTSGSFLQAPINVDEQGVYGFTGVWTGTDEFGQATGSHCSDWASGNAGVFGETGTCNRVNEVWTDGSADPCDSEYPLYCFSTVVATPEIFIDGFEAGDTFAWD